MIGVPVACVADMDVMPDCAPEILGLVEGEEIPDRFGQDAPRVMGSAVLEPHQRLVIADPRCERPTESRVLVLLGRHGLTTAKQAAKTLAISVRSAQAALQALVEDGALERVREGRSVGYVLEDTTFEEPTRH